MGQVDIQKFNSEQIAELQERVTNLELLVQTQHEFMRKQVSINEFFRRIVDDKYTKEELLEIYNRAERKKEENNEDSLHKNEENLHKSEENFDDFVEENEAPDEK